MLALIVGLAGWIVLGSADTTAALTATNQALESATISLSSASTTAEASADALSAAATSLDQAAGATDATAQVAMDMSDIAATLPPVIVGVSDGLEQIDASIDSINSLLDRLPFDVGQLKGIDVRLTETGPLIESLAETEKSLDLLAEEVGVLGPTSTELAAELRAVVAELETSAADLSRLASDLEETRSALPAQDSNPLLAAQILIVALALAIIIGQLPLLLPRRSLSQPHRPH